MRSRNIKPAFFTNPDLGECSPLSRLLFAGLWCCADREGRLPDRVKFIKAQIFPYDNLEIDSLLDELSRFGFIERYEVRGVRVISIPNFTKHQRPHVKEKCSELPEKSQKPDLEPDEHLPKPGAAPTQVGACPDLGENKPALNPECGMRNPECGMRNEEVPEPAPEDDARSPHLEDEEFRKVWRQWLKKQSHNRGRPLDTITEEAQLYSLERFKTQDAIDVVRFSISRTNCSNLITNGDHKAKPPPGDAKGGRRSKVSFDEGLLK